ncbi:hypothetical protein EYC80_001755 [Monilinia laxa]|uniref:Uncharacterized protein n=1 Tax=Monilinia laxa TaxID=61186 RepID=A0A5N6K616_MONLA|nr:hypothetical protein EYC80_001755 [Monilinia laxa]
MTARSFFHLLILSHNEFSSRPRAALEFSFSLSPITNDKSVLQYTFLFSFFDAWSSKFFLSFHGASGWKHLIDFSVASYEDSNGITRRYTPLPMCLGGI